MGMVINTNVDALDALRNLGITASKFSSSVQKLSSGLRINTAADDAAGLAISNKLEAQVTGLNQAQRNAQDGVSMVQTASGALNEITSMLQRVRELGVEAANATIGSSDASSINTEVKALQDEINRIANATTFNGQNLLTGSLSIAQDATSTAKTGVTVTGGGVISGVDVSGAKSGQTYTLTSGGTAGSETLTMALGGVSQQVNLAYVVTTGSISFAQLGVTLSITGATTKAQEAAFFDGKNVKTTTTNANANFQIGANATDTLAVQFQNAQTSQFGAGAFDTAVTEMTNAVVNQTTWTAGQAGATSDLINAADAGIAYINTIGSNLGAVQNRLGHTI